MLAVINFFRPPRCMTFGTGDAVPCQSPTEHGIEVGGLPRLQTIYIGISSGLGSKRNMPGIYLIASASS